MPRNRKVLRNAKLVLLALMAAASLWFYAQHVLIPYQKADALAHARPRGNLSDLYPRWYGARELLLHQRDPYSAEVTREIQLGYYGRAIDPSRAADPKDEERFAYPVYVVFLLAPFVNLPFPLVRLLFDGILALATLASVLLWLRVLRWRVSGSIMAVLMILTLGSFATVQGVKLEQLSLLVGFFIAASAAFAVRGHLVLAGSLLALATIKPQLALLPAAWLILWVASHWRERQRAAWGFAATLLLLIAGGEYVLPGWFPEFLHGLGDYERYTGGRSLLDVLTTHTEGMVLAMLILLGTAAVGWRLRRAPAGSGSFSFALAWVLTVTVVVAPMVAPYNQLLLLPAVFLIVRFWRRIAQGPFARPLLVAGAIIVGWPWLASAGLVLAALVLPPATVQRGWAIPLWTSLLIPLAVLGLLALIFHDVARSQPVSQLEAGDGE